MNDEELKNRIQYLRNIEKLSTRQIAEELHLSRGRCLRILKKQHSGGDKLPKVCVLDPYRSLVGEWYAVHPTLKVSQVLERLTARGVATSYTTVKRLTRPFRHKRPKSFWPMSFAPGEEAQVDWFIIAHPRLGQLAGFALILSYSRFLYAHVFPRMSFEFFIEGHLKVFSLLQGLTQALRYDNLRSVVVQRLPLTYNSAFLQFAQHYRFEIRLCNVRAGNEKGRVERAIRSIRDTFLNTADQYQSLAALNAGLAEWLQAKNNTVHRSTGVVPISILAAEPLKPLPQAPWLNRAVHPPRMPTKTGLIHFDTNQYSVPEYLVGMPLSIHAFCERVEIYDAAGKKVATHPRSFEHGKIFLNPLHRSFSHLAPATKKERIQSVMRRLHPLYDRFITLAERGGEDSYHVAHALFRLLTQHPRTVVLSAVREIIDSGVVQLHRLYTKLGSDRSEISPDAVHPQHKELLQINYNARSLEDYST